MKHIVLLLGFCMLHLFCAAQDSLKVMFYNLYRFPTNSPANREYLLKYIVNYVKPDLLMACEIVNKEGSDRILAHSFQDLPDSFAAPNFLYCPTATNDPLQQMAYYNTRKLTLLHQEVWHTIIRDINHYTFYLNTSLNTEDTIFLDAYVTHLKAGSDNSDEWLRTTMIDTFIKATQQLPENHHVLFAGDFNFYSSQETAYQILTDTANPLVMEDPINRPGDWHNNPDFQKIHSQATRKSSSGFGWGGASGAMDDRFDFILMSQNLRNDNRLYYLPGSYKVIGNNGNCFNKRIDNDSCFGQYPLSLRHVLFQMSDHAPVVMTLYTPEQFPTTSINNINNHSKTLITFPEGNMAHRQITVKILDENFKNTQSFAIYDMTGKLMKHAKLSSPTQKLIIHLDTWTKGIYFIRYRQEVRRFIKY